MPRGLKVSHPLIVNMILFIDINIVFTLKNIYIMIIGMLEMIVFHFSTQRKNIIEHTNGKCHVFTF